MNQQGFYIPYPRQASGFYMPWENEASIQQNLTSNHFDSYAPFNNVKSEIRNQSFNYNNSKKIHRRDFDEQSPQRQDLFSIQKRGRKQRYKRSTNNSHKKFISALRRLFYSVISVAQKEEFQKQYGQFKSCRTFFFIILAYMKERFGEKLLHSVKNNFIEQMQIKIQEYVEEIKRTKNGNLKNFREEEIIDIKYSISSCIKYLNGNTRGAIEEMYKKGNATVVKRQHYDQAVKNVYKIQKELEANPKPLLQSPYVEDLSNSSQRQRVQKKAYRRELRHQFNRLDYEGYEKNDPLGLQHNPLMNYPCGKKERTQRRTQDTENDQEEADELSGRLDQIVMDKPEILYPPMLEAIPFIKYDPFLPPFRYRRQARFREDVREDFFGAFNYGFPSIYQGPQQPMSMNHQSPFSSGCPAWF